MTARTRSRLVVCFIVALLTLPVEAVLLPVARTPSPEAAALEWVDALGADDLAAAAADIQSYPTRYRRAIMTTLDADTRAAIWRGHVQNYRDRTPNLTEVQMAVLDRATAVMTAEVFTPPLSLALRAEVDAVFQTAITELGEAVTTELFVNLGPKDVSAQANALPWRQRMADSVRSWRVVSARSGDCNCNPDIDTCDIGPDPWLECSEMFTCEFDLDWPMCGPLWSWACTGWCRITEGEMMEDGQ